MPNRFARVREEVQLEASPHGSRKAPTGSSAQGAVAAGSRENPADVAGDAVTEAASVKVEAKNADGKAEAALLCRRVVQVVEHSQTLAASLPDKAAFARHMQEVMILKNQRTVERTSSNDVTRASMQRKYFLTAGTLPANTVLVVRNPARVWTPSQEVLALRCVKVFKDGNPSGLPWFAQSNDVHKAAMPNDARRCRIGQANRRQGFVGADRVTQVHKDFSIAIEAAWRQVFPQSRPANGEKKRPSLLSAASSNWSNRNGSSRTATGSWPCCLPRRSRRTPR